MKKETTNVVDILGAKYAIKFQDYEDNKDFKDGSACGLCDSMAKDIIICNIKTSPNYEGVSDAYVKAFTKEIMRHELTHAFLYESGLADNSTTLNEPWATNEELVDWFAIQAPKIYKVFKELDLV